MKPFKTIYMVLHDKDIVFPKKVQYLEDGYYLCKGQLNELFTVSSEAVAKLNQDDLYKLIKTIHTAVYTRVIQLTHLDSIDGDFQLEIYAYPSGQIRCKSFSSTIFVPRNCFKWENVFIRGYFNDSYVLEPCDEKGKIIKRGKSEINPYTNNCNIVYNMISENAGINTYEIIDLLGWPPNSVTSRLSELMACGRITSVGRVLNPKSGRKVHKWMTTEDVESASYVL